MPAQKTLGDLTTLFSPFQFPTLSLDQLASSQRRNLEALTAAAQVTAGSVQTAWQRQWEFASQFAVQGQSDFQALWSLGTPGEKVAQHAALAKSSVEKATANAREIVDLLVKSGQEAAELLTKRVAEGLTELQGIPAKA